MRDVLVRRMRWGAVAFVTLGLVISLAVVSATGVAETGTKALILESSVSGGALSEEATNATGNGFAVTVVDDATWASMTAAQFADYQLIIIGDPFCGSLPAVVSQNAQALADAVMARAGGNTKAGNRILIGTDPVWHSTQGGNRLIETGIDFAGVQDGATNLYLNTTCIDPDYDANGTADGVQKLLPLLTEEAGGAWTHNAVPPCGGSASLISNADQFSTLTSADLQGWSCSVHQSYPTFPTDWTALAIATDTPTQPTCGTDVDTDETACGEAYVLIAGSGIIVEAPDLALTPATATNTVGTSHTVTATVTNPDDTPRSGATVDFVVTGANPGATGTCVPATCVSNSAGQVTFTYAGANAGTDTINAAITIDGSRQTATASKTWVNGRMVGKGAMTGTPGGAGSYAYIVRCNSSQNTNAPFELRFGSQIFRLTSTSAVSCTNDPAVTTPAIGFDTMTGTGAGTLTSGGPGTIQWKFVDAGTSGTGDSAQITIRNSGGTIVFQGSSGPPGKFPASTQNTGNNTAQAVPGG